MIKFVMCEKVNKNEMLKKNEYMYCRIEEIHIKSFRHEPLTCISEKRILPPLQDNWTRLNKFSEADLNPLNF